MSFRVGRVTFEKSHGVQNSLAKMWACLVLIAFFLKVLPQWLRSSSAFSWGDLAVVPSSLRMPTLIDLRWMVVQS